MSTWNGLSKLSENENTEKGENKTMANNLKNLRDDLEYGTITLEERDVYISELSEMLEHLELVQSELTSAIAEMTKVKNFYDQFTYNNNLSISAMHFINTDITGVQSARDEFSEAINDIMDTIDLLERERFEDLDAFEKLEIVTENCITMDLLDHIIGYLDHNELDEIITQFADDNNISWDFNKGGLN